MPKPTKADLREPFRPPIASPPSDSNLKPQDITGDFKKRILEFAKQEQDEIIKALMDEARKGDTTALKEILERILGDDTAGTATEEEVFPVSEERFKEIILIAARRIQGDLYAIPSSAGTVRPSADGQADFTQDMHRRLSGILSGSRT